MRLSRFIYFPLLLIPIRVLLAQSPENKITKEDYIELYKGIAIEEMNMFGIPASITIAQGILESGNGNSILAKEANNHFGIKCHKEWTGATYHMDDDEVDECFRKYENPYESFKDHSLFLTSRDRYACLFELDITDYVGWAKGLKSAGYATNPNYAEILIKNIEEFKLYKYDQFYKKQLATHHEKAVTHKKSKKGGDDFDDITIGAGARNIYKNNGIQFVYAKDGDNFEKIANDVNIAAWQLCNHNDLKKNDEIKEGQMIYIAAKKNKATESFHVVQPGETLFDVSQKYGIKLKKLCKYNTLSKDATLFPNQKLKLR
jgi:LysM repeat protein